MLSFVFKRKMASDTSRPSNTNDLYLYWLNEQLEKLNNCAKSGEKFCLGGEVLTHFMTEDQRRKIDDMSYSAPERLRAWMEAEILNLKERAGSGRKFYKRSYNPLDLGQEELAHAENMQAEWTNYWNKADGASFEPQSETDLESPESPAKKKELALGESFETENSCEVSDMGSKAPFATEISAGSDVDEEVLWSKIAEEFNEIAADDVNKLIEITDKILADFIADNPVKDALEADSLRGASKHNARGVKKNSEASDHEAEGVEVIDWEEPDTPGGRTRKMVKYEYNNDNFFPIEAESPEYVDAGSAYNPFHRNNSDKANARPEQEFPRHRGDGCLTDDEKREK